MSKSKTLAKKSDNVLSANKDDTVLLDLVKNIKEDNIISNKNCMTFKCCAAKKHATKEKSLNDLNNGLDVYLNKKKDTTGKNDIFASYVQCSVSTNQEGNSLCHIHLDMKPENLIKFKDLIETATKATPDHEYYCGMGIRGAKGNKKNSLRDIKQSYSTQNIDYITSSNNIDMIKILETYAKSLVIKHITKSNVSSKPKIIEKSNDELLKFLEKKNENNNSSNELVESDNENESNELVESDNENNLLQSSHQETIDENEEDDEEGVECVEITTINGTTFYLDESSTEVYKIVEDENILVGKLKEINQKYSQINHKDKKYSIFCEETKGGKPYLKCYLTDKKFDINLKPLK
jgi:hypothetical protein